MRRRIVKSCFSLAAILLWGIFGTFTSVHSAAAQSASAWPLVNCAINTPCVNNEPVNTHTGDSLPDFPYSSLHQRAFYSKHFFR